MDYTSSVVLAKRSMICVTHFMVKQLFDWLFVDAVYALGVGFRRATEGHSRVVPVSEETR